MKIITFFRKKITRLAEAAEIIPKRNNPVTLPDGMQFDAKLRPQLAEDVFDLKNEFANLRLVRRINSGRDANVYDVQGHPDWVLRIEHDTEFKPQKLKRVEKQDEVLGVIASNPSGTMKILKKLEGEPLHGKDWDIFEEIRASEYFSQLTEIENIPDEAFIKYYEKILDLRKKGYQVDTTNPNNILYDAKNKIFNIVDIEKKENVTPEVTIRDFYTFLDGARIGSFYRNAPTETRSILAGSVNKFINRILNISDKHNMNLQMEEINHKKLQSFLVYIYRNDEEMLKIMD